MKNWKHWAFVAVIAIVGIIIGFVACDKDNGTTTHTHEWEWRVTTPATTTADGVETETCKTCGETRGTRPIEQTEPTKKNFTVNFLFQNPGAAEAPYQATVMDQRTNCGSQNLEQLKVNDKNIVTIIEEGIMGGFNTFADTNIKRSSFRRAFGIEGGITIIVNNPDTTYKVKAIDEKTICFHIDYLKRNPDDIQKNTFDAVRVLGGGGYLPWDADDIELTGTIEISPNTATIGTELTANYSGTETVNYQWVSTAGIDIEGATAQKFIPNEAGWYAVKVSAKGYRTKASDGVQVTAP